MKSEGGVTIRADGGRIRACESCGRLMVACLKNNCPDIRTYNRPFVRFCRRCGENVDQTAFWNEVRQDGWDLKPESFDPPELIADLSSLVESRSSERYLLAIAMVRGALAVHHAGQYLALLSACPGEKGKEFLWEKEGDPFPPSPDRPVPAPHTPRLLPGERYLMYSSPQGVLVLDLWSCHELSAKDNEPEYRIIQLKNRSLIVPPIALDEHRIGLLTRGWSRTTELPYRWAVWDRSLPKEKDAERSAFLETEASEKLPIEGRHCRCEVIDNRVIAFSTVKQHWVWQLEDAAKSSMTMLRTWPNHVRKHDDSIVMDDQNEFQTATNHITHSFLVQYPGSASHLQRAERFSWFYRVRRHDGPIREEIERYDIEFKSLDPQIPQSIRLTEGAKPIGAALDLNDIPRMYFKVGGDIWYLSDGLSANLAQGGLPRTIVSHQLAGPLILSVGSKDHDARYIQLDSLHHQNVHGVVSIENKLISDPLLWFRWLYTVELNAENRLSVYRRIVKFDDPLSKPSLPSGDVGQPEAQ